MLGFLKCSDNDEIDDKCGEPSAHCLAFLQERGSCSKISSNSLELVAGLALVSRCSDLKNCPEEGSSSIFTSDAEIMFMGFSFHLDRLYLPNRWDFHGQPNVLLLCH